MAHQHRVWGETPANPRARHTLGSRATKPPAECQQTSEHKAYAAPGFKMVRERNSPDVLTRSLQGLRSPQPDPVTVLTALQVPDSPDISLLPKRPVKFLLHHTFRLRSLLLYMHKFIPGCHGALVSTVRSPRVHLNQPLHWIES